MMYEILAILAVFIFLYSISSGGLERTPVNGAIVFASFGLLFGPLGLGLLNLDVDAEGLRTLAELTLALILFTDAAHANLAVLIKNFRIPQRLLLIGLPLTILLGFIVGIMVFKQLSLLEIVILSVILAPTDAALGKAVVTDKSVPENIREGLNVESGLNDGICVPILFVFLALMADSNVANNLSFPALRLFAEEIGIGIAVGAALAILSARLIKYSVDRKWITNTWQQLTVAALAIACFALAQALGGSGFIAAFAAGLIFGVISKPHKHNLLLAAEGTGDVFALITWVVFGSAVISKVIGNFTWEIVLYAALSLTLIRMLPVFLALSGIGLRTDEKLFIGWFGPRGLASIVFGVIVLNEHLPGGELIALTAVCTILLSIIAHGLSAHSLVARLAARLR